MVRRVLEQRESLDSPSPILRSPRPRRRSSLVSPIPRISHSKNLSTNSGGYAVSRGCCQSCGHFRISSRKLASRPLLAACTRGSESPTILRCVFNVLRVRALRCNSMAVSDPA